MTPQATGQNRKGDERRAARQALPLLAFCIPGWTSHSWLFEMQKVSVDTVFLVDTLSLALLCLFALYLSFADYRSRAIGGEKHSRSAEFVAVIERLLLAGIFARAISGYIIGALFGVRWLIVVAAARLPAPNAALLGVLVTLVGGGILFFIRLKARSLYALLELGTALGVAAIQAPKFRAESPLDLPFLLAFVPATIYLFVRGCDNLHTAWTKGPDIFVQGILVSLRAVIAALARLFGLRR